MWFPALNRLALYQTCIVHICTDIIDFGTCVRYFCGVCNECRVAMHLFWKKYRRKEVGAGFMDGMFL